MKTNKKVEAVFNLLGVKPGETFKIPGNEEVLVLNEKLQLKRVDDKGKQHESKLTLDKLFTENESIVRITALSQNERKITSGFYCAGYRYIARDADGDLHGYTNMPHRTQRNWIGGPAAKIWCEDGFEWLTWESGAYELQPEETEEQKTGEKDQSPDMHTLAQGNEVEEE